jgi:hypothetical protein
MIKLVLAPPNQSVACHDEDATWAAWAAVGLALRTTPAGPRDARANQRVRRPGRHCGQPASVAVTTTAAKPILKLPPRASTT